MVVVYIYIEINYVEYFHTVLYSSKIYQYCRCIRNNPLPPKLMLVLTRHFKVFKRSWYENSSAILCWCHNNMFGLFQLPRLSPNDGHADPLKSVPSQKVIMYGAECSE